MQTLSSWPKKKKITLLITKKKYDKDDSLEKYFETFYAIGDIPEKKNEILEVTEEDYDSDYDDEEKDEGFCRLI